MEALIVISLAVLSLLSLGLSSIGDAGGVFLDSVLSLSNLTVQGAMACTEDTCPGSQFTKIATAWANIGYVTHSDVLYYIGASNFGLWAPLLYICAALAAFVGVAINMPMRTYTWFLLGPALYSFLVGTTTSVQGVDWVVANQPQKMEDVWRDAEVGLINTDSARRKVISVRGKDGPEGLYEVAYPMVFLDELFSATTNLLIEWLGVYRHAGDGGANANAKAPDGQQEGPWYLLSSLKWGMLENIVGASARNPDFRDAFITFLASECGDAFKQGVESGKYIAASQSMGTLQVDAVLKGGTDQAPTGGGNANYEEAIKKLDVVAIPTPRSLVNIFRERNKPGQFGSFSQIFSDRTAFNEGRYQGIVCSEYLYTLIQQFRFEAGHAFWQLVRSSPNGLNINQFLQTLFYGWDIRPGLQAQYASSEELTAFVKHLIMVYLLRNEMMFAPEVSEVPAQFSPTEMDRRAGELQVRALGSKSKQTELYNWAILMPHLQGILVYFLLIAYPFVAMVIVLPGHWKTLMTWVSFFAWVKLWDVGFAIVMVLERSVWAMIGNSSHSARTATMIIKMAEGAGGVGVGCPSGTVGILKPELLAEACAVPAVCSLSTINANDCNSGPGVTQPKAKAWFLFDKLLAVSSGADLDLANGYYIYIMAALYLAVPAVTGQLVLGAKAGASGMINSAIGGVTGEAGRAAMSARQADLANLGNATSSAVGQAAYLKGSRQPWDSKKGLGSGTSSLAEQAITADVEGLQASQKEKSAGLQAAAAQALSTTSDRNAQMANTNAQAHRAFAMSYLGEKAGLSARGAPPPNKAAIPNPANQPGSTNNQNTSASTSGGGAAGMPRELTIYGETQALILEGGSYVAAKSARASAHRAAQQGYDSQIAQSTSQLDQQRAQQWGQNASRAGDYAAQMQAWEQRNTLAMRHSAAAGVIGGNLTLSAGPKPTDQRGMAVLGELNRYGDQSKAVDFFSDNILPSGISASEQARFAQTSGAFSEQLKAFYSDHSQDVRTPMLSKAENLDETLAELQSMAPNWSTKP